MQVSDLKPLGSPLKKLLSYLKVFAFLLFALIFWLLFGWFADYSFPYSQSVELLIGCFLGTVSTTVNELQKKLQETDLFSSSSNRQQVKRLNSLESQAWLYQGVLQNLARNSAVSHERVAKTIEAIESKRHEILQELESRRPKKYQTLARIQQRTRSLLMDQADEDYIKLERIISSLISFTNNKGISETILADLAKKIATEIEENASQISPNRLRLAYKVEDLIKLLSSKLILVGNISRKENLTLEEYEEITNKDDYEYVSSYFRRDGTPVKEYYRRRRSR